MRPIAITKGSGDVFADLGFSPAEAGNLRVRSQLMTAICDSLRRRPDAGRCREATKSFPTAHLGSHAWQDQPVFPRSLVNMITDAGMEIAVKIRRPARRVA